MRAVVFVVLTVTACSVPEYRYTASEAGSRPTACDAAFCDDFEGRTNVVGPWNEQVVSSPWSLSLADARERGQVFQSSLEALNEYSQIGHGMLRRRFDVAPKRVKLTLSLRRLEQWPVSDHANPFALAFIGLGAGKYVALCHQPWGIPGDGGYIAAERSGISIAMGGPDGPPCAPCGYSGTCIRAFSLLQPGDWQRASIELTYAGGAYTVSCCDSFGVTPNTGATIPAAEGDRVTIGVGMSTQGVSDPPAIMQFDDVIVDLDPR